MRLNGGILGKNNTPNKSYAPGIWGIKEFGAITNNNLFPRFYEGYKLDTLFSNTPKRINEYMSGFTNPSGLFFKPDGTKAYYISYSLDDLFEYDLSPAWDMTNRVLVNTVALNTSGSGESVPYGIFFKSDGTILYTTGQASGIVRYNLSTAWDISTATYSNNFDPGICYDVFFKEDGYKMYACLTSTVESYNLSTAWDLTTVSSSTNTFSFNANIFKASSPRSIFFKSDGTKAYIVNDSLLTSIVEVSLSTAWDMSTASYEGNGMGTPGEDNGRNIYFKPDGSSIFITGYGIDDVHEYELPNPWDIGTGVDIRDGVPLSVISSSTGPRGFFVKNDGTRFYTVNDTTDYVYQYDMSTAYDLTTATANGSLNFYPAISAANNVYALEFKPDGTKLYLLNRTNKTIIEYSLSTAWDITTASLDTTHTPGIASTAGESIKFKPDGTKMYLLTSNPDEIEEWTMSTAWDLSTLSEDGTPFSLSAYNITSARDFIFTPDGERIVIYSWRAEGSSLFQFTLSTPWSIDTATNMLSQYNVYMAGDDAYQNKINWMDNGKFLISANGYGILPVRLSGY